MTYHLAGKQTTNTCGQTLMEECSIQTKITNSTNQSGIAISVKRLLMYYRNINQINMK